jgi:glycerol-3-phosphate dehydrogenase (NAD(P)+)
MPTIKDKQSITVIGGGSWATAIVKILGDNKNSKKITWWVRNPETIAHIKKFKHNPNYLSDVEFDLSAITLTSDIKKAIRASKIIVLAVPSAFLHETLKSCKPNDFKNKIIVSAIKGVVQQHNLVVADYMNEQFGVPELQQVVIAGPCHAEEVALERLSYLTFCGGSNTVSLAIASQMQCHYIKTSTNEDLIGAEYGAVLKNVYALASGICHGLGYGDNFQAVLVANAVREMKRFIDIVKPIHRDVKESAYLGDLLVTAYSLYSRNRMFGTMIGKGCSVKFAQMEMNMIAEGYYASKCMFEINKRYKVDMPIMTAVYHILYQKKSARIEIKNIIDGLN